jgi:hypothetical protein
MKDDGDVFATLGWGARRYAWVIALFVVALGMFVPTILDRTPDRYEAEAQVGPAEALNLPNLDALPRVGESVFNNGAVAESVRRSVNPPLRRSVRVVPDRVELVAAQDNIVFTIIGRGGDPESASRIANIAAQTFALELNKYAQSVGSFAIQRTATPPAQPVPRISDAMSVGIGVVSGLALGVGVVALLLVWRRPVIDFSSVKATTGAPVLGRLKVTPSSDDTRGMPQLCRLILSDQTNMLFLVGPRSTRRERRLLASELSEVLAWTRHLIPLSERDPINRTRPRSGTGTFLGPEDFVIIEEPTQIELATRPATSLVLLVAREGISYSALRRQAEQYFDGGAAGVVLVHGARWHPRWWAPKHRAPKVEKDEPKTARTWRPDDPIASGASD